MSPDQVDTLATVATAFCTARGLKYRGPAGSGAFKATFCADAASGEAVAVKVYLPGAVSERAVREVEAMAQLSRTGHSSLPRFLDLLGFEQHGVTFVVSIEEFLDGGNLSARVNGGPLDRDALVRLARQMSSALSVVAGAGLVHRDIKPDNIMFRGDGTAVLVDFGLVRNLGLTSLTQTWLAQGPGTPYFAAPEQLNNEKALIDRRTDQFALGTTLAIAGFGAHPYQRAGDPPDAVVGRVARRETAADAFITWARDNNLAAITRMVEPWPVARYRTPSELERVWAST